MFGRIGTMELVALLVVALLIFGRRLPEVGRSLGRGLVEFKKGLAGIEEDMESAGKPAPANKQIQTPMADAEENHPSPSTSVQRDPHA